MATFEHYDENEQSLQAPCIVLRNSLGALAVQVLASRNDLSKLEYTDMLRELNTIIRELQQVYEHDYHLYNED